MDDQHRRPVSRESTHAVFVGNDWVGPGDVIAGRDHCSRQADGFLEIEAVADARRHKRGQMQVGVEALGDVRDNGGEGSIGKTFAVGLGTNEAF
jgi:hypothetical protein